MHQKGLFCTIFPHVEESVKTNYDRISNSLHFLMHNNPKMQFNVFFFIIIFIISNGRRTPNAFNLRSPLKEKDVVNASGVF